MIFIAPAAASYNAATGDNDTMISSANATGGAVGWAGASIQVNLPTVTSVAVGWFMYGVSDANKAVVFAAPQLAPPAAPTLGQTPGGVLGARTRFVQITYVNLAGETFASTQASFAISANNLLVVASPGAVGNAISYNVYAGTSSGPFPPLTLQNVAPIALGTNWTEPLGGITGTGAPVPTASSAPSAYILDGGQTLNTYETGPTNYQTVTVRADGTNFRITDASSESRANMGATQRFPWRFVNPGGPGYQATEFDNGNIISSALTGSGLTVTLPATSAIVAGWMIGLAADTQPLTLNVTNGSIITPTGQIVTSIATSLAPHFLFYIQYDGANFRQIPASPATSSLPGEVVVQPFYSGQASGAWCVTDAFGFRVSTVGTTTGGINEGIAAAVTSGTRFHLKGQGTIPITGQIHILANVLGYFQFDQAVSIQWNTPGANDIVLIDTCENSIINLNSQVIQGAGGTGHCVLVKPTVANDRGNTVFTACELRVGSCTPTAAGDGVFIDLTNGECRGNRIDIGDVNGGTWALQTSNPGGGGDFSFSGNIITHYISHGQSAGVSKIGQSTANQGSLRNNKYFYGSVAPNNGAAIIHDTFESGADIFLEATDGVYGTSYNFRSGTSGNRLYLGSGVLHAGADAGTGNTVWVGGALFMGDTINADTITAHLVTQWAGGSISFLQSGGRITGSPQLTPAGTPANTTETTLQTYTIPGNLIGTVKQSVRIRAWGSYLGNADSKRVRLYFGASEVYDTVTLNLVSSGNWIIDAEVFLIASGVQNSIANAVFGQSASTAPQIAVCSETQGNPIVIKVTGQNGTGTLNNIICNGMTINVEP